MLSKKICAILASALILQGCVAAAVVTVMGGASVASDNRSLGRQIDDQKIEFDAHQKLAQHEAISNNANLQIVSVNGSMLIVGQAPNTYLRDLAIKSISEVKNVAQVHNQIRISNTTSITTKTNDVWLTSKVKAALFNSDELDATNIKVVTENAEVFLMGLVTSQQSEEAVNIARNVGGVNRVFKIFELQPDQE